jgi:serine/threonine protein kinase
MAPELLFDEENYSFPVDIFSFGMVLLETLKRSKVGQKGFAERSPRDK